MNSRIVIISDREVSKEETDLLFRKCKDIVWIELSYVNKINKNVVVKKTKDYLSRELCDQIDERATYFAQNWAKIEERNFSEYQGIYLSELIEYDALLFYIRVLKNIELFRQIMLKESPDEIVLISEDEILRRILLLLSEKQNIKVRIISKWIFRIRNRAYDYFKYLIEKYKVDIKKVLFLLIRIKNLRIKNIISDKSALKEPTFFVNNHRVIRPVVEKILEERKANIIFFNTDFKSFERYIKKDYWVSMFFEFKIEKDIRNKVKKNQKQIMSAWNRLVSSGDFRNRFVYNNIFFWGIIEEKLRYFWTRRFRWAIKNIETLREIIKESRVKRTVVWNDILEPGRTMISVSRQLEIPSLLIQDGIYVGGIRVGEKLYADKIAVWGEASKKQVMKWGNSESRIFITGNPEYDKVINVKSASTENKGKMIVFVTQMVDYYSSRSTDTNEQIIDILYFTMKRIGRSRLVIKVHPGEKVRKYQALIKNRNYENVKVIKKIDLFALLKKCSILITHSSTVALEAMILGKPVMIVNLTGELDGVPYVQSGAALGVYNEEDVYPTLTDFFNNPDIQNKLKNGRKQFVETNIVLDGKTIIRVNNLLFSVIN